jgi:hypothetical protein
MVQNTAPSARAETIEKTGPPWSAIADETRKDFDRVASGGVQQGVPESIEGHWRLVQWWFAGNHSDIGGGYPEVKSPFPTSPSPGWWNRWSLSRMAQGRPPFGNVGPRSPAPGITASISTGRQGISPLTRGELLLIEGHLK